MHCHQSTNFERTWKTSAHLLSKTREKKKKSHVSDAAMGAAHTNLIENDCIQDVGADPQGLVIQHISKNRVK